MQPQRPKATRKRSQVQGSGFNVQGYFFVVIASCRVENLPAVLLWQTGNFGRVISSSGFAVNTGRRAGALSPWAQPLNLEP